MATACARYVFAQIVIALQLLLLVGPASGQDAGVTGVAVGPPKELADERTGLVRSLLNGTLDVNVTPASLFDVALDDEVAVQIDAARLRTLLLAADEAARPQQLPPRRSSPRLATVEPDAGDLRVEPTALDPALFRQRLSLDRARLEFYELSAERRAELLRRHATRQEQARPAETEAARQAHQAEAERLRALQAARLAHSEAERLVSEELARLISVETRIRELRTEFEHARAEIAARRDIVFGWHRRVRDAKASGPSTADSIYDALRGALRAARNDLSGALDALNLGVSRVPMLGRDALVDVPADVSTDLVRKRRAAIERAAAAARRDEQALLEERAAAFLDEISSLNRERLGLLPSLSLSKRNAITGFTTAGWDQARSEARHLSLILRYHHHAVGVWVTDVRRSGGANLSPWRMTRVLLPLVLVVAVFGWGRRKTQALLLWGDVRFSEDDRSERRTASSVPLRAIRILLKTHRGLEWILLFLAVSLLLPSEVSGLLEVQLISSVLTWSLAGALVVSLVNAVASQSAGTVLRIEDGEYGRLRLRSLQLVGRTFIVFALILLLSARLVGEGTIFRWIFSVCWFAAIPVFLLLVRWWRETVFERIDRLRKRTPLQAWIQANRSGWKSFAAATIGAVQLFTTGALKLIRRWLSGFDLARRIHAYLFRREIERIGEGHAHAELASLTGVVFEKLSPAIPMQRWLSCPADAVRSVLTERARVRQGAMIAVVASRGMGKSALLHSIAQDTPGAKVLAWRSDMGVPELQMAFDSAPSILLIDDAHTLIEPRIGGFAQFDKVIALARAHSDELTWVFAIDASVWPLLKRARDARPMFDETFVLAPWDERALGALLADRCDDVGIAPQYDTLLDRLPPGVDESERQDALMAKRAGYDRMLWDHVGGNPGLALEAWRVSLRQDATGVIHVRPLQVPDVTRLERLPDLSLFVLRAVLQLAPTAVDPIALATRLRREEVIQELRFGKLQGFYDEDEGQVQIAWRWLRAVSRLLERRHLLVNP